jgi:hypothetical protein
MTEFELIRAEPLEPMSLGEVQSPPKAITASGKDTA